VRNRLSAWPGGPLERSSEEKGPVRSKAGVPVTLQVFFGWLPRISINALNARPARLPTARPWATRSVPLLVARDLRWCSPTTTST